MWTLKVPQCTSKRHTMAEHTAPVLEYIKFTNYTSTYQDACPIHPAGELSVFTTYSRNNKNTIKKVDNVNHATKQRFNNKPQKNQLALTQTQMKIQITNGNNKDTNRKKQNQQKRKQTNKIHKNVTQRRDKRNY